MCKKCSKVCHNQQKRQKIAQKKAKNFTKLREKETKIDTAVKN